MGRFKKTGKRIKGFKRAPKNKKIVAPPELDKKQAKLEKRFLHIDLADNNQGQPGKYIKLDLRKIYRLCVLGMTNQELAEHYDVKFETWTQWCNPKSKTWKPGLTEAISKGREDIVARVADRLVQRALGYKHKAKKFFFNSSTGEVITQEYIEHYPPSEDAGKFILKNKRPQDWKDKQVVEGPNGQAPNVVSVTVLTDDSKIKKLLEDKAKIEAERAKKSK